MKYNVSVNSICKDFRIMEKLPVSSIELENMYKKYEDLHEELFDPNMIIGKK